MDPLEQSRVFVDCFKANVNPADPLPVRVPIYNLKYDEIKPAIVDWTRTYLDQFGCPPCILTPIIRKVCEEVLNECRENPQSCGFSGRDYKTLQLNHEVISRVNRLCSELQDNENLNKLLAKLPTLHSATDQPDSVVAIGKKDYFSRGVKNRRRTMEDRHVCLPDFSTLFNTKDTEPTAYYGVFDGHGGQEAATFAASHLHYYVSESDHYPHDMARALAYGFIKTDSIFLNKCHEHRIQGGTTAVVCFHRPISKNISIAWVGDSQAILVKASDGVFQYSDLVSNLHSASNPLERHRILHNRGNVILWGGQYRVNGQLAITRAIGNPLHKPFVTATPECTEFRCEKEDCFIVLASDGLWDSMNKYDIIMFIFYAIRKFPDNPQKITDYLIEFAKPATQDNITVIILYLKDLQTIIEETPFIEKFELNAREKTSRNMDINGADNSAFLSENSPIPLEDKKAFVDIQNFVNCDVPKLPKSASPLCAAPVDNMGFLSDGGFGPETDVDDVHDLKQELSRPEDLWPTQIDVADLMDRINMGGCPSDLPITSPEQLPEEVSNNELEGEASSVSAEPVDLSEDQATPEVPFANGSSEHHFDAPSEAGQLIADEAELDEDVVPAMKAELNENELEPMKPVDEPMVNDLLGGDSIVDNKLIDQLDSFGISDAIRRQLIEQQVTGAAMNHEQEEDEDDGQLIGEKHTEFDGTDDGAEKGDLHHEKAFDSDNIPVSDHHSTDVKQDDDAGCCEDSEEDEWDYVKVNQQQQEQQQEQQPQAEEKPHESTLSEETVDVGKSNSFVTDEELVERHREDEDDETHELEQHRDQEDEQEQEQPQQQNQEEPAEVLYQEQEREAADEVQLDGTAESTTSEAAAVDILGDNTESTVSESTKEVDDVIIGAGEAKEVVNLLNDFKEDVPQPTATETCETSDIAEEDSSAALSVPCETTNMEASMYGGSVAEQPQSPDAASPVSPVDAFQQQQQQPLLYGEDKDMFGSGLDDTVSPNDADKLNEKHLYEAEEKTMHQGGAAGDLGWQLNPEAKEFVPVVSPTGEQPNPFAPAARMLEHESFKLRDDAIVAQSPRKGTASSMEDLDVPAEREFHTEMDKRPHEFEAALEDGGEQQSPLSPNPFDQLDDRAEPASNGLELLNGGELLQPELADLLLAAKVHADQFPSANVPAEDFELLNKVQELPVGDDEEQPEALIAPQQVDSVQAALFGQEELGAEIMEPETYSAKEELYVEQKETVDDPAEDASPVSEEVVVQDFNKLSMNGHTEEVASNPFAQDIASFTPTALPAVQPIESDMFSEGQKLLGDGIQEATEEPMPIETDVEPKRFYQESLLETSVYDPEPSLLSTQETNAPTLSEPVPEPIVEPEAVVGCPAPDLAVEPLPKEEPTVEVQPLPVTEQSKESTEQLTEDDTKKAVETAATGVAVATAVVAAAAVAATATAASKTAKPKAPVAATATKKAAPATTTKSVSAAVAKDGAAKSATTAPRLGSGSAPTAASRKPTLPATKKAPTTTAGKTTTTSSAAATNGVKEARPAPITKPSLAAKKPATDATKTATTKTTATGSSVAAARTTKTTTTVSSSSTTKPASASSTTRTAAPKAATTTAAKPTSRLSTTGTATRTVTSRPSSAISTSSVPSKPASATTTSTTVKRTTVAAKTTNGTTTTDGVSKTTKTTTTSSTTAASRTGVTRTTGTKPASTLLAAKKTLDTKTPAAGTKTSATTATTKPSTTTRTSLAPKPATSPAVRKVQQNGVAKKPTAGSPNPTAVGAKKAAVTAKKPEEQPIAPSSTTTTTTTTIETNGSGANEHHDMVEEITAPPTALPSSTEDQLLVPVPQAM